MTALMNPEVSYSKRQDTLFIEEVQSWKSSECKRVGSILRARYTLIDIGVILDNCFDTSP